MKLSVDKSNGAEFRRQIQEHVDKATSQGGGVKLKNISIALDQQKQAEMRERLQNYLTNSKFTIKVSKIDAAAAITELKQQIRTEVMGLTASTSGKGGTVQAPDITTANKELNMLGRSLDSVYRRISSADGTDDLVRRYRELSAEIQQTRTLEGEALLEATAGIQKKVTALRTEMDAISSIDKIEQQRVGTLKQISQLEGKLGNNLAKTLPGQSQSVGNELSGLKLDARMASSGDELTGVRNRYMEVAAAAKAAGLEAQSFGTKLQGEASKLSVWALATSMIMGAVKAVKDMIVNVKRLDMELIELKKVTDLTRSGYEALIDEAAVSSRKIGATLSDTIRAQADFARLGHDVNGEAQSLAQAALVYKHVGDGIKDISEASESIISTMKAFGVEAENAMGIVDEFNEVGNKFAISSSGIGVAMQKSSASLAAANNTLEESIGLTVGMNNVIQNPEIVGTALKTMSMYLRAAKAEAEEAGESTEGMAISVSKLRSDILALTKQKVDIQIDENTFKSTYQIMKEISAVWSDIADIDQAALLELLGGKRNATAVVSLLTNFGDAERAMETAMDAAGSAMKENEKWLTGIEGHMSQFSAAFENLSRNIIDSELFKGLIDTGTFFIDVLNGITEGLDKVTGGLGGIPVAVAAITAAVGLMSKTGVKGGPFNFAPGDLSKAAESVKAFGAHFQKSIKDVGLFKAGVGEAKGAMEGIKGAAQHAGESLQSFWTGFSSPKDVKALLGYATELNTINEAQAAGLIDIKQNNELAAEAYKTHIGSVEGLKASTKSTAAAMQTGAVSAKAFANGAGAIGAGAKVAAIGLKALSIAANMLFNMAIAAVITAIIKGIDNFIHRAEIAAEKAREAAQAANEVAVEQEERYSSLVLLVEEYQKLSASGKINTEDIEKARDLQNQIVQIVGRQVDGLDLVNGASAAQVEILKEQLRLRAEDARIAATAAYGESVGATEKVQPLEKGFLGMYKGAYNSKHWADKDEKAAVQALRNAGLWKDAYYSIRTMLIDEIMPGPDFTITLDFDMDGNKLDTIYKKINFLREQIAALEKDETIDVTSNPVYLGLVKQVQAFEAAAAPNIEASVRLLESVSTTTELASGETMKAVQSLEQYNKVRDDLIKDISGNASLTGPLESGAIAMSRVESAVDSMLARNIPEWFNAARSAATETSAAFIDTAAVIDNLSDSIDNISKRQKILQAAMSEMGAPAGSGGISADTVKSIQDALTANEKLTDYVTVQNGVLQLNTEAWNKRTFGDMESQIAALRESTAELEKQNAELGAKNENAGWLEMLSGQFSANAEKIKENTAAIEANQEALNLYQAIYDQLAFVDIWDFSNMANDLGSVQSAAGGLISAMQQLKDGTALTKAELAKLAIQYPELLAASNLFTTGSAAGQKALLNTVLQTYEAQYDAEIDKDIAILEATNTLLQNQIDLEDQKSTILAEIGAQEVTGRLADQAWLQEKLAELNDLEGQNYATMEGGKLTVNQEALEGLLRQTGSYGTQSDSIWTRITAKITNRFTDLIQKAKKLALTIMYALVGKVYDPGDLAGGGGGLTFSESDYQINDQGISTWLSEQETILAQRRVAMTKEIDKNLVAIENLKKLKGLDLTSLYGASGSGGKGSSVKAKKDAEEYTAKIDALYEAEHRLAEAQRKRADIEAQINREDNPTKRTELRKKLIDAYNEEIDAAGNLLQARQGLVDTSVEELRKLGFEIEYNDETNQLYIANMERVNELTATSKGKYDSLQEATNELRKSTEQLIDDVQDWNKTNQDAAVAIDGMRDSMRKAKTDIIADISEMRKAAEDALKEITSAYDTLNKASALTQFDSGNIEEAFFPSVSTFQSLMAMESKYLNLLNMGAGAITINRTELKRLTAAKVEDLAVTQAMALVDTIAVHREDTETLREMAGVTQHATDATWDLVYAKLAQQNLDKELNDAFLQQIEAMQKLSKRTKVGIYLGIDDSALENFTRGIQGFWEGFKGLGQVVTGLAAGADGLSTAADGLAQGAEGLLQGVLGLASGTAGLVQGLTGMAQGIFNKVKSLVSDMLKQIKAFVDEFIRTMKETYKNMLGSQKSGLDDVLKLTMDLVKYEVEMKIKGLREQIEAYKEIVDLKKKELDLTREQAKYEEGLADRVADIARLQAEIAQLSLDDSREAAALRAAKEKELADKQKELANYQDDHAYDGQVRALDDAAEAYEKAKQKEIEELEASISSAEKIYQMAVKRLEEDFWGLYQQVIDWNTEAGSSINKEITQAWEEAAKAVVLYGGYLNAVKAIEIQLKIQAEGIGAVIADLMVDAAGGFFVKLYDMFATFLNKFLKYIGVQLPTSENTGTTGGPITPGGAIIGVIGDVIGGAINGIVNGVKNFVGGIFSKFPFFHSGGHVGGKVSGRTSDPAEEVIAVLQTDEVVLTKQQQKNLLTQLDFLRELGANVDAPVSLDAGYAGLLNRLMSGTAHTGNFGDVNNYGTITVSAPVEVIIQHSGAMDDATAARFGKKVAETTVGTIYEAFRKKGIHPGGGNGALKP